MVALILIALTEDTQNGFYKCLLPFTNAFCLSPWVLASILFSLYQAVALVHPAVTLFA